LIDKHPYVMYGERREHHFCDSNGLEILYIYPELVFFKKFSSILIHSDSHHTWSLVFLWVLKYSRYLFFVDFEISQSSMGTEIVFSIILGSKKFWLIRSHHIFHHWSLVLSRLTTPFVGYSFTFITDFLQWESIILSRWNVALFPVSSWEKRVWISKYSSTFWSHSRAS
jgi:hypothetical protein